ncbi:hypothetical protein GE061_001349 [Apolygus lucorum]|uniref:Uncharacterized protein n=1 Tax=Apolygus lucorum TaxID=248454 RepID=A0A6A4ISF2_APOLU|nr:hypothetical protein GE061_001349 [Apolygus lucorum]
MVKLAAFVSCLVVAATANAAFAGGREAGETGDNENQACSCSGPECQCCVSFNLTYMDLGGPGCVKMKYLSKDEGLMVNVSYGDSQLHGGQVKGPSMTCMDILLDLAQMCAKFSSVAVTDDGMEACASLVPSILGDAHDGFQLGCFVMGSQGMKLINSTLTDLVSSVEPAAEQEGDSATPAPVNSEEALIAAVNESAEEGIAWFGSFLGFNFGKSENQTTASPPQLPQNP